MPRREEIFDLGKRHMSQDTEVVQARLINQMIKFGISSSMVYGIPPRGRIPYSCHLKLTDVLDLSVSGTSPPSIRKPHHLIFFRSAPTPITRHAHPCGLVSKFTFGQSSENFTRMTGDIVMKLDSLCRGAEFSG